MRTFTAILALTCLSLALFACKDRERAVTNGSAAESGNTERTEPVEEGPTTTTTPQNTADQISDSLVFSIMRGACFGTCPFYELKVYRSGFATYNGLGNVEMMGEHRGQVGQDTLDLLVRTAEEHGFFEMEAEYDKPVTDLPSTTIIVRRNGDTKKVKGRVDPPASFKQLATRVEEILLPRSWEPVAPQD